MDEQIKNRNAAQFVNVLICLPDRVFLNVARNWAANDLIALEKTFKILTDRIDLAFKETKHFYANIKKEEIGEMVAALLRCGPNLRTFKFYDLESKKLTLADSDVEENILIDWAEKLAEQCPNIEEFDVD